MGIVLFWIVMALAVAVVASTKGRSGFGWFFYGLLIWPVALAHVAFIRRLDGPERVIAVPVAASPGDRLAKAQAVPPAYAFADFEPRTLGPAPEGKMWKRHTKFALPIRGLTKDNPNGTPRQEVIAGIRPGDYLAVVPEPDNPFDKHALRFMTVDDDGAPDECVGYVPGERAEEFAKRQAAGSGLQARVEKLERVEGAVPFLAPRIRFEIWELEAKSDAAPARSFAESDAAKGPWPSAPVSAAPVAKPSNTPLIAAGVLIAIFLGMLWHIGKTQNAPPAPAAASAPARATPVSAPVAAPVPRIVTPRESDGQRALTRDEIIELQILLGRLGFDVGTADGIAGAKTRAAIRALESRASWEAQSQPVFAHLTWARFQARRAAP